MDFFPGAFFEWIGDNIAESITAIAALIAAAKRGSELLSKMKKKILGKDESWKDWTWNIDDDERNQEQFTSWQGIPFREIRFFHPHPRWPKPIPKLSEGMSLLMPSGFNPEDQAYRYEVGTMKHVNGYGGPLGALCYCVYRREGGKNQIKMFFASPGNRDVRNLPLWWRLRIVPCGDGTMEQFTIAQRLRILILDNGVFARAWARFGLDLARIGFWVIWMECRHRTRQL